LSFILIVLIYDFQKLILVSESALCKSPFIYKKDGQKTPVVNINVILLIHAINLLKHTQTTILRLPRLCLGQPGWAGTRWYISPSSGFFGAKWR